MKEPMSINEMCETLRSEPAKPSSLERAGSVAEAIVEAIKELDRHIEKNGWSSNTEAKADRTRLVSALIDMGKPLNK